MINAYDYDDVNRAQDNLGLMCEFAVYNLKINLKEFWKMFLSSELSKRFAMGETAVVIGKTGIELALEVAGIDDIKDVSINKENHYGKEYWTGWAIAYYQCLKDYSFEKIEEIASIEEIQNMYYKFHEMDITQFCDEMDSIEKNKNKETKLKTTRTSLGLSQSQLAKLTGIPVRTIQQYEQRQKDINAARAEYVISLAKVLFCEPVDLLERN